MTIFRHLHMFLDSILGNKQLNQHL